MADLTTLAAVKQYLSLPTSNVDSLVQRLIPRESRHIERWTGRVFPFVSNVSKRLNGTGTAALMLPDQPILAIQSLFISNTEVLPAASDTVPGYLFDDTTIYLGAGAKFPRGLQNVVASWTAGYSTDVATEVPTGNTPTLLIEDPGQPVQITSVTTANGVVLTATANAPAAGEYQFNRPNVVFNSSDAGTPITVGMYYVPAAVEQACIEMIGLDIKQRDNLGIRSKTLANETVSYEGGGMTASVKEMLYPYRKVAPV